jgi:hypothetical protein
MLRGEGLGGRDLRMGLSLARAWRGYECLPCALLFRAELAACLPGASLLLRTLMPAPVPCILHWHGALFCCGQRQGWPAACCRAARVSGGSAAGGRGEPLVGKRALTLRYPHNFSLSGQPKQSVTHRPNPRHRCGYDAYDNSLMQLRKMWGHLRL